jgi:hypothetical protein
MNDELYNLDFEYYGSELFNEDMEELGSRLEDLEAFETENDHSNLWAYATAIDDGKWLEAFEILTDKLTAYEIAMLPENLLTWAINRFWN